MFDAAHGGYFPPDIYDHPFQGELQIISVPPLIAKEYCSQHGVACVISLEKGRCVVILNTEYHAQREAIIRHETGHCNGWPNHHPGAR